MKKQNIDFKKEQQEIHLMEKLITLETGYS